MIPLARIPIKNVGKCGTAGRLRVQGSYPTYPELLVLERRRPTSVILRTPAFLVFFVAQPILAVLLSGSWTISKAWRMTPVYPEPAKGPSLPEPDRSLSSRLPL